MSEEQKSSSKSDDKKSAPVPAPRKLTKRKNLEKLKISAPYDFRHVAHLGIDSGPSDLKNLSKIDEIDSHLQEKDALQNLEAAAAGLHVPSWSSEVLEDKQAQDDDMTESKRAAVKPVSKEHRPQSTAKVETPAEKHPPSSMLKEQPENSSPQGKKELAKASMQSTEESAKPAVQHTEKATKLPVQQKQESVKTSIHSVEKPEKSLTQRTDKPEKSSVQHKKEPSVSYLHRTKELEETSLQNTTNSQRPSSSQQNEPIYSVIRKMDVPQSKKKSKAPSPPVEAGISKMDTSHNGEVKEIRMPAKPSSSFNKKEADGSQTSDKTTKPSVPSLAKRHETVEEGVDRKHGSTLPSSSCTATTIPVAPHRPSKSLEEKPKQPLPPWMTDMATKDQKRLCAVWLKTLDRSDHSHSSHNVMEKVAKFEASSSVKVPISFRKVAPLPPSRQEALKKSVELDVHPPKRELRRVMSQPPSRPSAVKKVGNVYSTTDENSELNQPVPKPRLKKSRASTEAASAPTESGRTLIQQGSSTPKRIPPKIDSKEKDSEDSDEDITTIRL